MSETNLLTANAPEVPKKRGRPIGWRGTYKKRVKAVPEVPQETKESEVQAEPQA